MYGFGIRALMGFIEIWRVEGLDPDAVNTINLTPSEVLRFDGIGHNQLGQRPEASMPMYS